MSRMKEHKLEHYFNDHNLVSPNSITPKSKVMTSKEMLVNSKSS